MLRSNAYLAVLLAAVAAPADAGAWFTTQVVFDNPRVVPFEQFITTIHREEVVLNEAGQAAFPVNPYPRDDNVYRFSIYRGDGEAPPVEIFRSRDDDFCSCYLTYSLSLSLNNSGQVAFDGYVGLGEYGSLFIADGVGPAQAVASKGKTAAGVSARLAYMSPASFNDSAQAAFVGWALVDDILGTEFDRGIYRSGNADPPDRLAYVGEAAPGGVGTFTGFGWPTINESGLVGFRGSTTDAGGSTTGLAIYLADGLSVPRQIVRDGQLSPDGNGRFDRLEDPVLNNSGSLAFFASLADTADGFADSTGVYISDPAGQLKQIARAGEASSDGDGVLRPDTRAAFGPSVVLNEIGQVAFFTYLTETSNDDMGGQGIYRGEDREPSIPIARLGQAVPDGNGTFSRFDSFAELGFAMNDSGQIALLANIADTLGGETDNEGIYLFDDLRGLMTVVRKGDRLLGSTITDLSFRGGNQKDSGLNAHGQVAYAYRLADGREGVAIATLIPEPSSAVLLVLGLLKLRRLG